MYRHAAARRKNVCYSTHLRAVTVSDTAWHLCSSSCCNCVFVAAHLQQAPLVQSMRIIPSAASGTLAPPKGSGGLVSACNTVSERAQQCTAAAKNRRNVVRQPRRRRRRWPDYPRGTYRNDHVSNGLAIGIERERQAPHGVTPGLRAALVRKREKLLRTAARRQIVTRDLATPAAMHLLCALVKVTR
jgi:hypothetical protein